MSINSVLSFWKLNNPNAELDSTAFQTRLSQFNDLLQHLPKMAYDQFVYAYLDLLFKQKSDSIWYDLSPLPGMIPVLGEKSSKSSNLLKNVAVLKLNGGLGTTMGCDGPKSLIEVREGQTFLDILTHQIKFTRNQYNVNLPLIFLNSFNTHSETQAYFKSDSSVRFLTQHYFPRIKQSDSSPFYLNNEVSLNPPGHGDVYTTLYATGMLDQLLKEGITYLFISNVDNLGATVDSRILEWMHENKKDFLMEVTPKTLADVKGGAPALKDGKLTLLERAQVPENKYSEFENIQRFSYFNTNNIWVHLPTLKAKLESGTFFLPTIFNKKCIEGTPIVQLETAMGAAISQFENAVVMNVPRSRFIPVKKTSDLLLLRSNYFSLTDDGGVLESFPTQRPVVFLSSEYDGISQFEMLFKAIPSLKKCRSLHIEGAFEFGPGVEIEGDVTLKNEGADLKRVENKLFSSQLALG